MHYFVLTLEGKEGYFEIPIHHHLLIQAALYDLLEDDFARFLHDRGFQFGKRSFKLFVFSRLIGKFDLLKREGKIRFIGPTRLYVSSPLDEFNDAIMNAILRAEGIRLGQAFLQIKNIECRKWDMPEGESFLVRTMSPITVYSTLFKADGRKYTHYYHPREKDFSELIRANLLKKYLLLHGEAPEDSRLQVDPVGEVKEHILMYKGTVIKAYGGTFRLTGSRELMKIAFEAGISVKNSQGFGFIEPILERR